MASQSDDFVVRFRAEGARELESAFRTTSTAASEAGDRVKGTTRSYSQYRSATDSVLEGNRRVRTELKGLAFDLSGGMNATDALRISALRLSDVFKIGLGPAVAIGAGAVAFGKIQEELSAAAAAFRTLQGQLQRPLFLQAALGADALISELQNVTKATDDLISKRKTIGAYIGRSFWSGIPGIEATGQPQAIAAARQRQKDLAVAIADAELRASNIRADGLDISEHQAAMAKIQLDAEEKLAKLHIENSLTKPGRDALNLFKRDAAIRQDADEAILQEGRRAQAVKETVGHARDLADIDRRGLSPLADKLAKLDIEVKYRQKLLDLARTLEQKDSADADLKQAQANKTNAIRQSGLGGMQSQDTFSSEVKATIASLQPTLKAAFVEAQKRSFAQDATDLADEARKQGDLAEFERLSRVADALKSEADSIHQGQQQLVDDARKRLSGNQIQGGDQGVAAGTDFSGVGSLAGLDFSGVAMLSTYDFSGLAPLDGLSISIQ